MFFRYVLLILFSCDVLLAWGATGHRIIGALAMEQLSDEASVWVSDILEGRKLQDVSTWADEIRSEDTPWSKSISKWHMYNFTSEEELMSLSDVDQQIDWPEDLFEALVYLRQQLRLCVATPDHGVSTPKCAVLLKLMVHMIADAHQPLHVGYKKDRGALNCKLYWYSRNYHTVSLHHIWDSKLIEASKLSYSEYVDFLKPELTQSKKWADGDFKSWLQHSNALHERIFPYVAGTEERFYCKGGQDLKNITKKDIPVIGHTYIYKMRPVVEEQLLAASVRLAYFINGLFSKDVS